MEKIRRYYFRANLLNHLIKMKIQKDPLMLKNRNIMNDNQKVEKIKLVVSQYYNLDDIDIVLREREIVQARQIAMYFSRKLTKFSLSRIGSQIGGKDHATVLHACKAVGNLIDTDKKINKEIQDIEERLYKNEIS